jgi:putative ABC transport system permease protein
VTSSYTSSLGIPVTVVHVRPLTLVIAVGVGFLTGLLAAGLPARGAMRVMPAEAMRGVVPVGRGHRMPASAARVVRRLPLTARLVTRNALRTPRRSVSTLVGVALAVVLVVVSLGMGDSVRSLLGEQFGGVQRDDLQLYTAYPPDGALLARVRATAGVAAAEPSVETPVVLSHGGDRYQTVLEGFTTRTVMHRFAGPLPSDGVVLGAGLRTQLHLHAGDRVDVAVPGGRSRRLRVGAFVDEPLGSLAYARVTTVADLGGANAFPSVLVRVRDGADVARVRSELSGLDAVVAVHDAHAEEQTVRDLLSFFDAIVAVMLVFGSLLAAALVFNTLSANLAERTVELATLRASGASVARLSRLVTGENLVLTAVALPVGYLAGREVAAWFMSSFDNDLYHFALSLRITTPIAVVVAMVGATLVCHWPVRRAIGHFDIARIVRERGS